MTSFLATLAVGILAKASLGRFRFPAGSLLIPLFAVALMNIFFDAAYMPPESRIFAQMLCGAIIGGTVSREALADLSRLAKIFGLVMGGYVVLAFSAGFLIAGLFPAVGLATSLLMCTPGGSADIALITADYGGDTPTVLTMQIVRLITGLGLIPLFPMFLTKRMDAAECHGDSERCAQERKAAAAGAAQKPFDPRRKLRDAVIAVSCAMLAGWLGYLTGLPGGTVLFALVASIVLALGFDIRCRYVPMRKWAMILNGCYIGSTISMQDVLSIHRLLAPALILLAGYVAYNMIMGALLHRRMGMELREALLITSPAGATEMALIAEDMGISSATVALVQMFRVLFVLLTFPQLISLALYLAG